MGNLVYSNGEFKPIYEHQVYSRKGVIKGREDVPVQGILTLSRYTETDEDRVVHYLQRRVKEIGLAPNIVLPDSVDQEAGLEQLIRGLPNPILNHIISMDEECIKFIRKHTSAFPLREGEQPMNYISVRYGIIPDKIIEANKQADNIESPRWYDIALIKLREDGFLGEIVSFNLLYDRTPNETLPSREELDILLKHGTHESKTLSVNRGRYEITELSPLMDFLYEHYPTRDKIEQMRDDSEERLEAKAFEPVIVLHRLVQKRIEESGKIEEMKKKFENGNSPNMRGNIIL